MQMCIWERVSKRTLVHPSASVFFAISTKLCNRKSGPKMYKHINLLVTTNWIRNVLSKSVVELKNAKVKTKHTKMRLLRSFEMSQISAGEK